ncbi:orotidine 5'-phosphate decarboxylase [Patescibacteria group bacterium]|nr:orotidine 5'-phosphate decarboxylase [Patescibacteria group bacterium]
MDAKERIIVALDTSDINYACELVEKLKPHVGCFKVGLELMTTIDAALWATNDTRAYINFQLVRYLYDLLGRNYLRDGKLHDIQNTVVGAVRATSNLGPKFFTIHALSGIDTVLQAVSYKGDSKLLVVTVLTSLEFGDLWNMGLGRCFNPGCKKYETREWEEKFVADLVAHMARWSYSCGADGVVCSPQELPLLEGYSGLKVTPGIRPEWAQEDEQKRIMTPREAILRGADYLAIGRPITNPPPHIGTPVDAVQLIIEEIEEVSSL